MKKRKRMCALFFLCLAALLFSACGVTQEMRDGSAGEGETAGEDNSLLEDEPAAGSDASDASEPSALEEGQIRYAKQGMKISILGDSISTFEGWIPEGNSVFFPHNGVVQDVAQTWWKIVLEEAGLTLCANGSSSGSTCFGDSGAQDPMIGSSDLRISQLAGEEGETPDIILVYMGTNDVVQSAPIGDNNGRRAVEEGAVGHFSDAYTLILDKLTREYPSAQIYCCTLLPLGDWGTEEEPFVPFVNGQGLTSAAYSDQIALIAAKRAIPVIDLYHCGITIENMQEMTSDGIHPTPEGMRLIADAVLAGIIE